MTLIFGAIPSPEDRKDFISTAAIPCDIATPGVLSYRDKVRYLMNQGRFGSCVGCASKGIKNIQELIDGFLPDGGLSALYVYALCKARDGIPNEEGTYPRIAMAVLSAMGIAAEKDVPYSLLESTGRLPIITEAQIEKGTKNRIKSYAMIPNKIDALKQALKTQGPVLGAAMVTDSFMIPEAGKFIGRMNGTMYGGHAFAIIGYNDNLTYTFKNGKTEKGFIEILNSWGTGWGDHGFAWIPYSALDEVMDTGMPFMFEMWTSVDEDSIPDPVRPKYWRVQTGAFSVKENAYKRVEVCKEKGFPTYVVQVNGLYKVQLGAFSVEANARNMLAKVKAAGLTDAFVIQY